MRLILLLLHFPVCFGFHFAPLDRALIKHVTSSDRLSHFPTLHRKCRRPRHRQPCRPHQAIPIASIGIETTRALSGLVASSIVGFNFDRILPDSGILVTLISAALISNVGLAPTLHPLYDTCWTTFLPGSLTLLLLSMQKKTTETFANGESILTVVRRVSVPFAIASVASVLGCALSFWLCLTFPMHLLPKQEATVATACQAASFVGGSVNFFATAAVVADRSVSTLVSSMATADLVVTAIFFAILSTALQSPSLKRMFLNDNEREARNSDVEDINESTNKSTDSPDQPTPRKSIKDVSPATMLRLTISSILVSSVALAIVRLAERFEAVVSSIIPGTACAAITVLAPLVPKFMPRDLWLWKDMQRVAVPLSQFCFLFLFASIGMSADLTAALISGPACLVVSLSALVVHLIGTLLGCLISRRWFQSELRFEDVLVASNAAIGGPATAAAFCGRIVGPRQKALTYAATIWGVVGYAIGTTLGVTFFRIARQFL
ncbi:predicted protein [Phaeodactylum tricornutum CCAP 1055/1]|jgi:uncharacterized membrane protein|uniref:Uncharacterized protein n=2 Tax=Phaeodactylum tricornutum TaxID=2850 RepID=B7FRK4_PHATC|nr:predicted protein [Phaeodactylum tricornutum CCAP 1055/1]EEC51023.1 predicted protein [Phaeodactylum tricornutum CCAP 1055/1]|eukprot:XP_002176560.1 predicted protein [Phaeodactylum tricornutum CCAP 1055/1]